MADNILPLLDLYDMPHETHSDVVFLLREKRLG